MYNLGQSVIVTPSVTGTASHEFCGTIVDVRMGADGTTLYTVQDMDNSCFDCEADELSLEA